MLSTKNIPDSKISKTFGPGNITAKINSITLEKGYNEGSYKVNLNLEGEDQGEDFEGFFKDAETKAGERYKGQVGRIRMSRYDYADKETASFSIKRDNSILKGLSSIADALGKRAQLDAIEVETIEELVSLASDLFSKDEIFLNWVIAGKEYQSGEYTNYELFVPVPPKGEVSYELTTIEQKDSKLTQFDKAKHIIGKAVATPVNDFEREDKGEAKDNFTL